MPLKTVRVGKWEICSSSPDLTAILCFFVLFCFDCCKDRACKESGSFWSCTRCRPFLQHFLKIDCISEYHLRSGVTWVPVDIQIESIVVHYNGKKFSLSGMWLAAIPPFLLPLMYYISKFSKPSFLNFDLEELKTFITS